MANKPRSPGKAIIASEPSVPDWQRTVLWQTLDQRSKERGNIHAKEMLPSLTTWMKQLYAVLRHGGSSPLDFTLHNDQHAHRVADRMAKLITPEVWKNISDYELALLLLAAYGHDIGMTPERQQVANHYRHLFHPESSKLSEQEHKAFQEFIDNFPARAVTLPLTRSIDDENLADELTTYYVRDRHNDWSADWLREHLQGNLAHLTDTVTILIRLCQSHHWGFERLGQPDFDPLLVGPAPTQIVHLRYLACLLRLADILENDPERTPEVIFRHRSIQDRPKSLDHWIKDHYFTIDEQQNQLVIVATPPSARIHHAIEQLADWIDHELRGIAAFGERLPVEHKVGRETIRRDWHLAPALIRRIQPQPDTYRYIDGAFRPNTQRLLQLLSNEQLYGKPIVAVRELLQNAFDAVREKIARKRLEPHISDKADRKWEAFLGDMEKVTLTLRRVVVRDGDEEHIEHHLICDDTGVGLTDKLITGHLLVSGQSRRHDILDLERRCKDAGFPLGRTGQFGIGVLSYFMLANEVQLTTTRYQGCGDANNQSWHFSTHGLSDFGELRPAKDSPFHNGGTRVEWILRPDRLEHETAFAADLRQYLKDTLIRIPCQFEFKVEGYTQNVEGWQRNTGWTRMLEEWKQVIVGEWKKPEEVFYQQEFLLSPEEAARQQTERAAYTTALEQAADVLRLAATEVPLPNGLGWTRLILPYFELPHGRSLFYPILDAEGRTFIENIYGLHAATLYRTAWKGMACWIEQPADQGGDYWGRKISRAGQSSFASETDIHQVDRETLEVSRSTLVLPDIVANSTWKSVAVAAHAFTDRSLSYTTPNFYGELNLLIQGRKLTLKPGAAWFVVDGGSALRPLAYPLTFQNANNPQPQFSRASDGAVIQRLESCVRWGRDQFWDARLHVSDRICQCGMLATKRTWIEFFQCWEQPPDHRPVAFTTRFPIEWRALALIYSMNTCLALQSEHPLVRLLSEKQRTELLRTQSYLLSLDWKIINKLKSPGEIAHQLLILAAWILQRDQATQWQHFQTNHPELVQRLWRTVAAASGQPLADLVVIVAGDLKTVQLSPEGIVDWKLTSDKRNPLPEVTDPEFLLVETEG